MLANSLLIRFSSSSLALAFLKSAMNCTRPRMFELLLVERPRKPLPPDDMVAVVFGFVGVPPFSYSCSFSSHFFSSSTGLAASVSPSRGLGRGRRCSSFGFEFDGNRGRRLWCSNRPENQLLYDEREVDPSIRASRVSYS